MKCLAAAAIALMVATPTLAQKAPGTDSTAPAANPAQNTAPNPTAQNPAPSPQHPATSDNAAKQGNEAKPATQANANNFLTKEGPDQWLAGRLINRNVYDKAGKPIGDLRDILIDRDGKVAALIVGVGGFLGLGEKDVAIDYNYIEHNGGISPNRIVIDMTREQLRSAPKFSAPASSSNTSNR
ncbi:MAG: PRC-barrel domain-containing protein [Rhodomicrobium sp.]